jgi:hypothetical protein
MRNKIFALALLASTCLFNRTLAQTDSVQVNRITYYNSFVSGVLIGCGSCNAGKDFTFSFLTQHGITVTPWLKVSGGIGMDTYSNWRLFPLVVGVTLDPSDLKNAPYFQATAGHAWGRYLVKEYYWSDRTQEDGGFTASLMAGYRIGNEKTSIYIQAGYKHQLAYLKDSNGFSSAFREYELNRFVIQFGFGFN